MEHDIKMELFERIKDRYEALELLELIEPDIDDVLICFESEVLNLVMENKLDID